MVLVEVTTLYRSADRQELNSWISDWPGNLDVNPLTTVTWTLEQDDRYAVVTGGTGAKAEVMGIYKPAHDCP